jgi:hypothetical protein
MGRIPETIVVFAALVFCLASCQKSDRKEGLAPASSAPAASAPAPAPKKGRAISALRACEIVSDKEVASLAGGKSLVTPTHKGPICMYVVELPGGDVESYQLLFQSPDLIEPLLIHLSPAEKGEEIPGLWDEAYLGPEPFGKGLRILAIRRGDAGMEVSGDRREVILGIAKAAASRVK